MNSALALLPPGLRAFRTTATRLTAALTLLTLRASCKGANGPAGPAGPSGAQGPQGPAGPVGPTGALNRADLTGVISSSGAVSGGLPASSTAGGKVPVIACYISSDCATWLAVAQTPSDPTIPFCGLTGIGTTTPAVTLVNVIVGYRYYLIAVW